VTVQVGVIRLEELKCYQIMDIVSYAHQLNGQKHDADPHSLTTFEGLSLSLSLGSFVAANVNIITPILNKPESADAERVAFSFARLDRRVTTTVGHSRSGDLFPIDLRSIRHSM
jgi:hypothetical protein